MITAAALAAAVTVTAATPSGVAAKSPKPLTVGVFDNYFAPIPKKAIKKGTTVRWKWDANALDVHDVKLDKGPKGAKKFQSDPLAAGLTFSKKAIKKGTTVRWKWDANALDVHDVKLDKGPKGAKKFQSDPLAAGLTFSKKLTVPGKYTFICTFHTEMTMKLTVAKS